MAATQRGLAAAYRRTLVLLVFAGTIETAWAQDPVFRSTTRLVEISMVARDSKDRPLTDLKREEISLFDKGQKRELAFFRFDGGKPQPAPRPPIPEGFFSNRVEFTPGAPRNVVALVLDTLNTPAPQQYWVRQCVLDYLKAMPPDTRIAIYLLGRKLTVLHSFTDDAEALRRRVNKMGTTLALASETNIASAAEEAERMLNMFSNNPGLEGLLASQLEADMMYNSLLQADRVETTLRALELIGAHMQGVPGRKSMVWIGGGISMVSITGSMGMGPSGSFRSFEAPIGRTARQLAQRGIALYPVDSLGLATPDDFKAENSGRATLAANPFAKQIQAAKLSNDPMSAMNLLAGVTGGRAFRNTNDLSVGLKAAAADMDGAYTIGFYVGDEADGKWRDLKVRVSRPGVSVLTRRGYQSDQAAPKPVEWTEERWRELLASPLGSSAIHLDGRLDAAPDGTLLVTLLMQPEDFQFTTQKGVMAAQVEIIMAEIGPTGVLRYGREKGSLRLPAGDPHVADPSLNRYQRKWKPGADAIAIRIAVRDMTTGLYGRVDAPLAKLLQFIHKP